MPEPHTPPPADLSKRWTQHLQKTTNTTFSSTCPFCLDCKIQYSENNLWKHINKEHGDHIPPSDNKEAVQAFQRNLRIKDTERRSDRQKSSTLQSQDAQSTFPTNQGRHPYSSRPHQSTDHFINQQSSSSHTSTPFSVFDLISKSNPPNFSAEDGISQLETRRLSQEQLVVKIESIYSSLAIIEAKCIEADNKHAGQSTDPKSLSKFNCEKWQALASLHITLLGKHIDFFQVSHLPPATALHGLALEHGMPARIWLHGILSFLELLRHRLPASLDHMLAFIYLAYSTMTLFYETVPAFENIWMEYLGDLGRYRMAIECNDIKDKEVWTGVAQHWYSKISDKSPITGRFYHHLAILARPNTLQQLYYYVKSLCVLQPFTLAHTSILTFFNESTTNRQLPPSDTAFVRAHGILFTRTQLEKFKEAVNEFIGRLDNHISLISQKFMEQGYSIAVANSVALLGFGTKDNCLIVALAKSDIAVANSFNIETMESEPILSRLFEEAQDLNKRTLDVVLRRLGDPNVLPFIHVTLVFMHYLSKVEGAMKFLESTFPWHLLAIMLNTLLRISITPAHFESETFLMPEKGDPRPFPEDFALRGLLWADKLFPENWFTNSRLDSEEKYLELPSMIAERKERILWLACRIASAGSWLGYNSEEQRFTSSDTTAKICLETEL